MASKNLFRTEDGKSYLYPFLLVTTLFFIWALCNGMIDTMDKHFQNELHLSKSQSAWVQFAHYLGYFIMALPAGFLARKLGYKGGIIAGLLIVAIGGFWFIPATHINDLAQIGHLSLTTAFIGYLVGVCVIASGLTFLETICNPYATVLGPKEYGAARINWAQSANGVGWLFGPPIGATFFYSESSSAAAAARAKIYVPYVTLAIVCLVLVVIFICSKIPDVKNEDDFHVDDRTPGVSHSIWNKGHFSMAVVAQFFYVGAQAGIFSFFINYMTADTPSMPAWLQAHLPGSWFHAEGARTLLSDRGAANLATAAFGCFLLGRVIGSIILKKASAHKVLGAFNVLNVIACALVFLKLGWLSVICVFASYFFMSITFPTIFALGLYGLGEQTKKASAYIVMAIMGGMVLPKLMGKTADLYDMSRSFILPLVCFVIIALYAYSWPKLAKAESLHGVKATGGH